MNQAKIRSMQKFEYLSEYSIKGYDYEHKVHKKDANRIQRHLDKGIDKQLQKEYNNHID